MCMFHVEKMKVNDFPFAVKLANTVNWNMTVEDFEFMLKLEPQGCFVQFHGNEPVGVATTISFEKVGWLGNFILKEDTRGKGAGNLLLKHAINYLKQKRVETIGLYAYPQLEKFYQSFGFKTDIDFLVMKGKAAFSATQGMIAEAIKRDLPEIVNLDCKCFGASRKKLLEQILLKRGNLCYISNENKEITGYVVAKIYDVMAEVGPLICRTNRVEVAALLLKSIFNRLIGLDVFIYMPKKEKRLLKMLFKMGFEKDFRVIRMFLGPAIPKSCIYAAESLERG